MKYVLPVIHHIDKDTTWEQATLAYQCGADGVFLISHFNEDMELAPIAREILDENWLNRKKQKFTVGLNLLNTTPLDALDIVLKYKLDALWLDNAGINSTGISVYGQKIIEQHIINSEIKIFASVAFKYQAHEPNPAKAAQVVDSLGLIATTSGSGTGSAPSLDKIASMVPDSGQLAVASGMTVENISNFKPYLSHILVATGVSVDDHHFDKDLLKKFIEICHA